MPKVDPSSLLLRLTGLFLLASNLLFASHATAPAPEHSRKLYAPFDLSLRILSELSEQGLYWIDLTVTADTVLENLQLRLPLPPELRLLEGSERSTDDLRPGHLWRISFLVALDGPGAFFVAGVEARRAGARLYRAASIRLGKPSPKKLNGSIWTDDHGRTFFVVPATGAP